MTNPNNAVGTNGALGGRTSVNAFNDNLAIYASRGIVSGWTVSPSSNMTVSVGGVSGTRDVAIAADASGNKTTVNNISGQPISVTLAAAPSVNSRIDAIVAYVQNPATVSVTTLDNPSACGIISVSGTVASSPVQPTDSVIRAAITADGAAGATAYYVIISTIKIATGTTTITSSLISAGVNSTFNAGHFADGSVTNAKLAANSVSSDKVDLSTFVPTETTLNSTYGVYYCKVGFMVFVRIYFYNVNAGTSRTFGTLPAGYIPTGEISVRNGFSNIAGHFTISNTGVINMTSYNGDVLYGSAWFCYPAAK